MTARVPPEPCEILSGHWVWACRIPWLPDLLGSAAYASVTESVITEAYGRQIALLRAIASSSPDGTAVQFRILSHGPLSVEPLGLYLLGRARSQTGASDLASLVTSSVPIEYPLEAVPSGELARILVPLSLGDTESANWAEVRRHVESLDSSSSGAINDTAKPTREPVVLPWNWSPQALLSTLQSLRGHPGCTALIVHVERARASDELHRYLNEEASSFRDLLSDDENPLIVGGLLAYRRWQRELSRLGLHMRVVLVSDTKLSAGIPEAVGVDLTRSFETGGERDDLHGSFVVARPTSSADIDSMRDLVDLLESRPFALTDHPAVSELQLLFDPVEAHNVFRLPITPEGGVPGVSTAKMSNLPSGMFDGELDPGAMHIGTTIDGRPYQLSKDALNKHILLAGLPGFGKTNTVHTILARASEQAIPFLVIDPAKSDYGALLAEISATGQPVNHVSLGPDALAFNPFAVPEGSTARQHGSRVVAAFDSAFNMSQLFPIGHLVLSRAVFRAYDLADRESAGAPTLNDVAAQADDIIRSGRFRGEAASNLRGSVQGRLEFLGEGSMGTAMLADAAGGIDWQKLTSKPCVIEIRAFASPTERSLIFALLLAGFVSFREANPLLGGLGHVLVLEEAHRIIADPESGPTSEGTRTFIDALAELRSAGQGFIVVEQAPSRLHPAVAKLTGTKIVHRTVEEAERQTLGASMMLPPEQVDDMARLTVGRSIAFSVDDTVARLVNVDLSPASDGDSAVPVARTLAPQAGEAPMFCRGCPFACTGRAGLRMSEELERSGRVGDGGFDWLIQQGSSPAEAWCANAKVAHDISDYDTRLAALDSLNQGLRRERSSRK